MSLTLYSGDLTVIIFHNKGPKVTKFRTIYSVALVHGCCWKGGGLMMSQQNRVFNRLTRLTRLMDLIIKKRGGLIS